MTPQERKVFELVLEALRKARRKVLTTEECHAVIMSIKEALAQPDQYAKGNWINAEDVSRNVKALDIALNGEGAASSPLLIDVLGQVQAEARRIGKPVLKALAQPEPCDMKDMCIGCSPRNADGSCPDAQRKPLTDEQKMALCKQFPDHLTFNAIHAIEAAHGIKE